MKYFVLLISAILLCSCSPSDCVSVDVFQHDCVKVDVFQHEGHSYLIFVDSNRYGFEVLHDPNCSCLTLK